MSRGDNVRGDNVQGGQCPTLLYTLALWHSKVVMVYTEYCSLTDYMFFPFQCVSRELVTIVLSTSYVL